MSNRFKKLEKQLDEWYSIKSEVEAIFGKVQKFLLDKLDETCSELWRAIKLLHDFKYRNVYDSTKHKKYENIINGIYPGKFDEGIVLNDEDGGFQKRFDDIIEEIQNKFQKHL